MYTNSGSWHGVAWYVGAVEHKRDLLGSRLHMAYPKIQRWDNSLNKDAKQSTKGLVSSIIVVPSPSFAAR